MLTMFLLLCVVNGLLWGFGANKAVAIVISSLSLVLFLLTVNFFRSPRRIFMGEREGVVVAPADGTVVVVEEVEENDVLHARAIQVSIFMSIFNVHANWFPIYKKGIIDWSGTCRKFPDNYTQSSYWVDLLHILYDPACLL